MAVKATYGLDFSLELSQCYSMSMMSDGGGGSIFGPIHGGTQGALGGQIRDESLRATVAELGRKVEEIRRILSNFSPETITTQGSGTTLRKYRVLASPAGSETVELPEDAPPLGEGQSLLDWLIAELDKVIADVKYLLETVGKTAADGLRKTLSVLEGLTGQLGDDKNSNTVIGDIVELKTFLPTQITLCIDEGGTKKQVVGKVLFRLGV